ncbi:6943_t:CDS:2, partial [Ambispora gerdemannii]
QNFPTSKTNNGYSNNYNNDSRYDMASGYSNSANNDAYPPYNSSQQNPYSTPFDDPHTPSQSQSSSYPLAPMTMNRSFTQYGPKVPTYPPPRSQTFPQSGNNNQTSAVVSKPLYDKNDPNAPRPPSQYGVKQESFYNKEYGKGEGGGGGNYQEKPKYGGFMGTFCCCGCGRMCRTNGFDFNFGLNISVDNPNFVGADFKSIKATAFYPGHTTPIGGGNLTDVQIGAKANTTINFPFSINYDSSQDPGLAIVQDILLKCGFLGGPRQQISIDYTLVVSLKVLAVTVSPSFSRTEKVDCPIKNNQMPNIAGLNINNAISAFNINKGSKAGKKK